MSIRRIVPDDGCVIDLDAGDARATLLEWYAPLAQHHLRLNLVTTLDGRAAGSDGTSDSLTSRTDRTILGVIRELSDVVLVGAESVRREGYLRPKRCALAIVSSSGSLEGHRLGDGRSNHAPLASNDHPVIVMTSPEGADRAAQSIPEAEICVLEMSSGGLIDPAAIVDELRRRGYAGIVAEGGPSVAGQLLTAGLVDEVCWSIMPRFGGPALAALGGRAMPSIPAGAHQLLLDSSGAQFGRWSVR